MKKRFVRAIAAVTVLATAALSLELIGGPAAIAGASSTASINVACAGVTGDNAGSVSGATKSSADLIALLAATGGPSSIVLPVSVVANTPDKVKKSSGPFGVSFDYNLTLPTALSTQVKNTLHQTSIQIVNGVFNVNYSGAESGSLTATTLASQTIDLNGSGGASVHIAGTIPSDTSGHLNFTPGTFNLGVAINGSVGGVATIGTLSLTCGSTQSIGGTSIQIPGAPDTPGTIVGNGVVGGTNGTTQIIGRSDITPDDGNPILPDSLKVVNGSNGAFIQNGALVQPTPSGGGVIDSVLELCGPSRPVPAIPGTNQVQNILWPTPMYAGSGPHPTFMTLTFDGQETAPIALSNLYGTAFAFADPISGIFVPPSPAAIQAALAALPNVGAGNVSVTAISGGYKVEWVGAKAVTALPTIGVGKWNTTPFDFAGYGQLQALIAAATAPKVTVPNAPPDPTATTLNVDQLNAGLANGTVSFTQWQAQIGSAFVNSITQGVDITAALASLKQIYPQPPDLGQVATQGVATIPATETGPLCSQFDVQTPSISLAYLGYLDRLFHLLDSLLHPKASVLSCTLTRVKVHVRVKSHGHFVTVTRFKTKKVCKAPAKKVVKKVVKKK